MFSSNLLTKIPILIFQNNSANFILQCYKNGFSRNIRSNSALQSISSQFSLINQRHLSISNKLNCQNLNNEEQDILYKSIELEARSADKAVLDSYEKFVLMVAKFLEIPVSKVWEPYRTIKRRTLLRAAFVKKKYRVQYESRTYYRSIELKFLTGSTANTFLEYIERNLPEGTALKVIRKQIEKLPSHLKPPLERD